jgi:beta-lactamase regulating signal transducer with metallopeptidase domain
MVLSYWLRLACLALFSLGTIQTTLFLLLRFAMPLSERWIDRMTARNQERIWFAVPIAPHVLALLLTLTIVVPRYVRDETNLLPERVGMVCFAGALVVAVRYLYAVLRGAWLLLETRRKRESSGLVLRAGGLDIHLSSAMYPQLAVSGVFSPRIVLSQYLLENSAFSPELLEIALDHEKAHVRHYDNLKHLVLVSLVLSRLGAEEQWVEQWRSAAEIAADEDAVSGNSLRAILLAETLLIAARAVPSQRVPTLCLSLLRHEEDLDKRVSRLLRDNSVSAADLPSWRHTIRAMAFLAASACVVLLLFAASFHRLVEYVLHLG